VRQPSQGEKIRVQQIEASVLASPIFNCGIEITARALSEFSLIVVAAAAGTLCASARKNWLL